MRSGHDSGAFGDKVAAPDPAKVPLGTDDEAGGARPTTDVPPPGPSTPGTYAGTTEGTGRPAILAAIIAFVVLLIIGFVLISG